jgi:fatty-acyl-CoA synthase
VECNLWQIFGAVSDAVPEREAIVWRERRYTYRELSERSARLAGVFAAHGIGLRRGRAGLAPWESGQDLVGLYMLNGPEFLEATLAGYAARAVPFNVNYRYVAEELSYLLRDAGAAALVYHARLAPTLAAVLPSLDRKPLLLQVADDSGEPRLPGAIDYEQALAAADPTVPVDGHAPDDLYALYTGGTTGMPKGTLWRQADVWIGALGGDSFDEHDGPAEIAAKVAAIDAQRALPCAPFMHGAAHWLALRVLCTGSTIVVNDVVDRLDPADFWRVVDRERIEWTLFVGDAFARPLLDEYEAGDYDGSSLVFISVGGAITSPATKARIHELLPQVLIADVAGASETGAALQQVSAAGAPVEAGVFWRRAGVSVIDDLRRRHVEPGEEHIGWFAKSGRIPLGYLGDREKTEATFVTIDGVRWSIPGDRARLRADGRVELLGRDSVTINSAGEKIFAEEVEQAMLSHDAVADVVVVGRPSDRWGQEVVAIVEFAVGASASDDELLACAAERIARYKLPKEIIRVERVERSPAGKADYRWARTVASAGRE